MFVHRLALIAATIISVELAGALALSQPSQSSATPIHAAGFGAKETDQFSGFPTYGDAIDCTPNHWITPDKQVFDAHHFSEQITCAVTASGSLKDCHVASGHGYKKAKLTRIGVCLASYLQAKLDSAGSNVSFHVRYRPVRGGRQGYIYYPANPNR